uniref:Ashwin n=1 Tax=Rhipicephalus appendiculatus TaxID=34631 RepID=A0A131YSR4_RHIAP
MAAASSALSEDVDLLYPELMSSTAIVNILKERYVKHPRLEELDKAALVQLYEKTVLPLPQREYRDTRLGRALSALREHADSRRKRKASQDSSSDSTSTKLRTGNHSHNNDDKVRQWPSEPHAKRGRKSSGGEWGSWDTESKSSKRSVTNRCLGEGDGPPRKKHRTPITWP